MTPSWILAAGVVEADHGRAVLHGKVHHLADFLPECLAEGPAEYCEILGKEKSKAAVDPAVAGHHSIAWNLFAVHAEIMAPVNDELIDLLKTLLVQKVVDSLPGRHLSFGVLVIDLILAAADLCFEVPLLKILDFVFNIHQETSRGA